MPNPLLRITCPHCRRSERMEISLPLRAWGNLARSEPSGQIQSAPVLAAAAVCPECNLPMGLMLTQVTGGYPHGVYQSSEPNQVDAAMAGIHLDTYPTRTDIQQFAHVPKLIADNFGFVQEDAARKRNPAGIMGQARGCLDVALKELGQTEGGRRSRINNLAAAGVITAPIAAWAQNLWEEGSDAAHDLTATIERAVEHVEFLKLFFEVAFELPARIAKNPHAPPGPTPPA